MSSVAWPSRPSLPGVTDAENAAGTATPGALKKLKKLKKACEQFEAVFAKQLLTEMRKSVHETKLGDSAGSEIYKDMMDQAMADSMASRHSLGIGDLLYKQFEKQVRGGDIPVPAPAKPEARLELRSSGGKNAPATQEKETTP